MPRGDLRGEALASRRRTGRPRLQLHLDDVQPSTVARHDRMLAQLNFLMPSLARCSLDERISYGQFLYFPCHSATVAQNVGALSPVTGPA